MGKIKILLVVVVILQALVLVNAQIDVAYGGSDQITINPQAVNVNIFQGNITNLSQLADVNIPSPSDDEVLTWDSGATEWIAQAISTIVSSFNITYQNFAYNQTTPAGNLTFNQTLTDILYSGGVANLTFNETLTDTLYAPIGSTSGNATFNETLTNELYILQINESNLNVNSTNTFNTSLGFINNINQTQFENNDGVLNLLLTWFTERFDIIFALQTTDDLTEGTTNLYNNGTFNETLTDTLYGGGGGNLTFNETLTDTLYAPNTTVGIQLLINSTGVYGTFNSTYEDSIAGLQTNLSDVNSSLDAKFDNFLNLTGTNANQNINISPFNLTAETYFGKGGKLILERIGGSLWSTIQDIQNLFHSSGVFNANSTVDFIVLNDDNTFNVSGGSGTIRATDNATDDLIFFDWDASNNIAIALDETLFVGVEYNAGSPQVVTKATNTWDSQTEFPLASLTRDIAGVHAQREDHAVGDHANNMINRLFDTSPFARANRNGGLIIGTSGLNITMTSGTLWEKLNIFNIGAIDTSGSDVFDRYYRDGVGGWSVQLDVSEWNNTHYDDGTGVLNALGNNRFSVEWIYLEADGEIVTLFGQDEFNSFGNAEGSSPPSTIPMRLQIHGIIIGRIIFQQAAISSSATESVFVTQFSVAGVTDHGDLAGLSDDDHTIYLLADGSRSLTGNWNAGNFNVTIGNILTFDLGETIENLIAGFLTITSNLRVTGNINSTGNITIQGNFIGNGTAQFSLQELADTGGGTGNLTFNETLTNTLYILQINESNLNVNSTNTFNTSLGFINNINETQFENNGGILNLLPSWLTSFIDDWFTGQTTDDLAEGSVNLYNNGTFNETLTDTLYAGIGATGNLTFNETLTNTLYAPNTTVGIQDLINSTGVYGTFNSSYINREGDNMDGDLNLTQFLSFGPTFNITQNGSCIIIRSPTVTNIQC